MVQRHSAHIYREHQGNSNRSSIINLGMSWTPCFFSESLNTYTRRQLLYSTAGVEGFFCAQDSSISSCSDGLEKRWSCFVEHLRACAEESLCNIIKPATNLSLHSPALRRKSSYYEGVLPLDLQAFYTPSCINRCDKEWCSHVLTWHLISELSMYIVWK